MFSTKFLDFFGKDLNNQVVEKRQITFELRKKRKNEPPSFRAQRGLLEENTVHRSDL